MITVSLCMIVKNEEDTLAACLDSVHGLVEEIIIVDTGSEDKTKEIALRYTDKIYDFTWIDDFSAARNFSFDQAGMDYILWLDADDVLLPEDAAKLQLLKKFLPPEINTVMMRYNTAFDENGRVIFSYFRERLSKRSANFRWQEPVHEYLAISGPHINSDICVTHAKPPGRASGRNIRIYENYLDSGRELSPRGMYYYARELKDNRNYAEAISWFSRFLDSGRGWVEDNIAACGELARCYLAQQQDAEALAAILQSFSYDTPRAELCCQVGYYFKARNNYRQAAFWFELVFQLERNENNWGFCNEDSWGYIPALELAVCYDKLGNLAKAEEFNEKAALYKQDSVAVDYNRRYFAGLRAQAGSG